MSKMIFFICALLAVVSVVVIAKRNVWQSFESVPGSTQYPSSSASFAPAPQLPKQNRDTSELNVIVDTNAVFLLTDGAQRRTGRDTRTGKQLQEIPNSAYFEDRLDNDITGQAGQPISHQAQVIRPVQGNYDISVMGVHDGPYELSVRAFSRDGSAQPLLSRRGTIKAGSLFRFVLAFTSEPGHNSRLRARP
jgi:hypothetical protein